LTRLSAYKNTIATLQQIHRWRHDQQPALQQFKVSFPDVNSVADWGRWPSGFVFPCCQPKNNLKLERNPWTFECTACDKQSSMPAGTTKRYALNPPAPLNHEKAQ
jgi:hypothetical protein